MSQQTTQKEDSRPSRLNHELPAYNTQSQAQPQHNSYWQTVLRQDNLEAHLQDSLSSEEPTIWQPIRYKLKLGLKGWSVSQTIVVDDLPLLALPPPDQQDAPVSIANHEVKNINASIDGTVGPHGMVLRPAPRRNRSDPEVRANSQDAEEYAAVLSHLRNTAVEEREQGLNQGIDILHSRLQSVGFSIFPIKTASTIVNHVFTRELLSTTYGGSGTDTFAAVDQRKIWKGGYSRFMCLNLLYNPHAPQFPGAPGLFYALRDPGRWPRQEEIVFARYGTNRWNLMGNYRIKKSTPISGEEFARLDRNVQQTWLDNIWVHKWGNYTLASVYLRREQGREPSEKDIEHYAKTKIRLLLRNVSRAEVKEAFLNGKEKINVWSMKCIGYDETFKRRLVPKALYQAPKRIVEGNGKAYDLRSNEYRRPTAKAKGKRNASPAGEARILKRRRF